MRTQHFANTINYSDIIGGRALFTNMIKNMDAAAREKMINDVELPDNYHDYTTQRGLLVRRDYVLYELVKYLHDKQLMSRIR